ncbi:hypothetical protein H5P28_09560 [Ruficoccus amylovorans]|uniref:Uncharacterized protein n=1 Tax=Ruficoccus amylovorans TaxID=1804625 RepID=A0A842HDB7_9BACT|nr:hypothetical protein [Ruficoccus amylovorans]MBC2594503.1 hypothetical protein [Ruficoccus amylovorans]
MPALKIIFCTFAAFWLPLRLLAGWLGLQSLLDLAETAGDVPKYIALVGAVLMLIDLWHSSRTQDDKIWWTVLGLIFAPIVMPVYWLGFGFKENLKKLKPLPEKDSDDEAPAA